MGGLPLKPGTYSDGQVPVNFKRDDSEDCTFMSARTRLNASIPYEKRKEEAADIQFVARAQVPFKNKRGRSARRNKILHHTLVLNPKENLFASRSFSSAESQIRHPKAVRNTMS
ncbi:hypothetical protein PpBr36_06912 [Pyricularia pennisetigena]|uniref:hypothetical protein n=1 Tax=Pyricularia pennisetigena TaxID=1578925 RepID=UPI00115436F0|nr:hypothetical protein PpBr36_06912 [Pyricularia pennisetigena]TLS25617.1 hypothetical protein PpBr36_06912 [Pyricularia pennisetigena]